MCILWQKKLEFLFLISDSINIIYLLFNSKTETYVKMNEISRKLVSCKTKKSEDFI